MVTKKIYEEIATIIKYRSEREHYGTVYRIADDIADILESDNPRFDYNRFMKACGLSKDPIDVLGPSVKREYL